MDYSGIIDHLGMPPAVALEIVAEARFGAAGSVQGARGFAGAEADFTWTLGPVSQFVMSVPKGAGDLMLKLALMPFIAGSQRPDQRLELCVNGVTVGDAVVLVRTVLAWNLPPECGDGGEMKVELRHPDASTPVSLGVNEDSRELGFALISAVMLRVGRARPVWRRRRPALPAMNGDWQRLDEESRVMTSLPSIAAIMTAMESLGYNCELGLAARRLGAEPQGLLRFIGVDLVHLHEGLDWGFQGIDDGAQLRVELHQTGDQDSAEWMAQQSRYDLEIHSFRHDRSLNADQVKRDMLQFLGFSRRQFLEKLRSGQKLFVLHRGGVMNLAEARAIASLLRSYGPCALLYLTLGPADLEGAVEAVEDGIYCGWINGFSELPNNAPLLKTNVWLSLCANAYRLCREDGYLA